MSDAGFYCSKIQPPQQGVYQGAFTPDPRYGESERVTRTSISDFAEMSGTEVDISLKFLHFGYGLTFPAAEAKAASRKGGALFIKLEPQHPSNKAKRFTLEDIAAGEHDDLLKHFAEGARRSNKKVFVSFAHEMNAHWYPWGNQPEAYKKAWQHVHKVVSEIAPNVTWVWNPDIYSSALNYYPGDEYVDWVAIDGYNWSGTKPAAAVFEGRLNELKPLGKPIMIGEYACAKDNAACLTDFVQFVSQDQDIKAFIYFDTDKEEKWAITTEAEQAAYSEAIRNNEQLFKGRIELACKEEAPAAPTRQLPLGNQVKWELNRNMVTDQIDANTLSQEQLEEILELLAAMPPDTILDDKAHRYSTQKFAERYPKLAEIKQINEGIYLYLRANDFANHWNNTILLFSVYAAQLAGSTASGKTEKMLAALDLADKFRDRIAVQESIDLAAQLPKAPSDYSQAVLDLALATLRAQCTKQAEEFYEEGIDLAVAAMESFLRVEDNKVYPSKPDYFSIAKAVLVLGDLYQQIGHLTLDQNKKQDYLNKAYYLYGRIAALDAEANVSTYQGAGLDVYLPHRYFGIYASVGEIHAAFAFNARQGYIRDEDQVLALQGIFTYLKGMAQVKQAALFTALPVAKGPDEVVDHLLEIKHGKEALKKMDKYLLARKEQELTALLAQGQDIDVEQELAHYQAKLADKGVFTRGLVTVTEADLLLMLAYRMSYYAPREHEDASTAERKAAAWQAAEFMTLVTLHEFEGEPYYEDLLRMVWSGMSTLETFNILANQVIYRIKDQYLSQIPEAQSYLRLRADVKELEIQARNSPYIPEKKYPLLIDSDVLMKMIGDYVELMGEAEAMNAGSDQPSFVWMSLALQVSALYLIEGKKASSIVSRVGDRGMSSAEIALELMKEVEHDIRFLPGYMQPYFNTYVKMRKAEALIQASQNPARMDQIKALAGIEQVPQGSTLKKELIAKAETLLKGIEREVAHPLPEYLFHKLENWEEILTNVKDSKLVSKEDKDKTFEELVAHDRKLAARVFARNKKDLLKPLKRHGILRVAQLTIEENITAENYPEASAEEIEAIHQGIKELITRTAALRFKNGQIEHLTEAQAAQQELMGMLGQLDNSQEFELKAEGLAWDPYALKANLYHQLAIVYGQTIQYDIQYQYAQSAYLNALFSSSPFDEVGRPALIRSGAHTVMDQKLKEMRNAR